MKGYKIDFSAKTITITAAFSEKMQNPASEEYKIILQIRKDFHEMKIVHKTHKTPSQYTAKITGEKFNCNQFKNLKYKNMEGFIKQLPNSEELMKEYDTIKAFAKVQTNGYTLVRRWFMKQFSQFRSNPLFYVTNDVEVVSAAECIG